MRCCVRRVRDLRTKIVYTLPYFFAHIIYFGMRHRLFSVLQFISDRCHSAHFRKHARASLVFCMPLLNGRILLTSLHMFRNALHKTCRIIVKCQTVRCLLESIIDTRMVVIVNWYGLASHHISTPRHFRPANFMLYSVFYTRSSHCRPSLACTP